jgi:hypothetical protein
MHLLFKIAICNCDNSFLHFANSFQSQALAKLNFTQTVGGTNLARLFCEWGTLFRKNSYLVSLVKRLGQLKRQGKSAIFEMVVQCNPFI